MTRDAFMAHLRATICENPTWHTEAILALSSGMHTALRDANQRAADLDMAMRGALVLASDTRVTAETRAALNRQIVRAIGNGNSPVERAFLEDGV